MVTSYKAKPLTSNRAVVLKVAEPGGSDFLKEEANYLATLNHPNIIKIFPALEVDGIKYYIAREPKTDEWYIALEYFEGGSLADWLKRKGKFGLIETLNLAKQIGSALEYAHSRGIVHGDVKPSNILLRYTPDGSFQAALSDFGATIATIHGNYIVYAFTPAYASPEQLESAKIDRRSDIYSLGVVLYQMLTGRLPYEGASDVELTQSILHQVPPPPSSLVSEIPVEMDNVILRALQKQREKRFQTVEEMIEALIQTAHV
jgi:serine/threonine-protein kinase